MALHNGTYTIDRQLSGGGMNPAYLACEKLAGESRYVVLKVFPQADRVRLHNEVRTMLQLRDENLVMIYTSFEEHQLFFLVLEYLNGGNLRDAMKNHNGILPVPLAIKWFSQICEGLHYLHTRPTPIVHQDLTPDNIALRLPEDVAVILDFGISRFLSGNVLSSADIYGKPGYASPEQYRGIADVRSDIYSLGATLYYCLTGAEPIAADDREKGHVLPSPHLKNRTISEELNHVILKALELDPNARYQSALEVEDALSRCAKITQFQNIDAFVAYLQSGEVARKRGIQMLRDGELRTFTKKLGMKVTALTQAEHEPDDQWALELAVRALGKLDTPIQVRTNLREVNDALKRGQDGILIINHTSQQGMFLGEIRIIEPWVMIKQPRFVCGPGETCQIPIFVDQDAYQKTHERQKGLRLRPLDPITVLRI